MGLDDRICTNCKGTGKVEMSVKLTQVDAIFSDGSYRVALEKVDCKTCDGKGYTPNTTTTDIYA